MSRGAMRTVLVTGGIGSGKSLVCRLLSAHGIPVYDADSRTKALYEASVGPDGRLAEGSLLSRLEGAFGRRFVQEGPGPVSRVDYVALSATAFASAASLNLLESVVHPAVLEDFTAWKEAASSAEVPPPFVVLESAIALEKPLFDGSYDDVVLVYASEDTRLARVRQRNPGLPDDDIRRRLAFQRFDFSRADYLLINDATPDALRAQVDALFAHLCA